MDLGAIAGWASVVLGQLVSWPQVLKLRRERGDGVSLASYAIVTVSMTLFFLHAFAIRLLTLGDRDGHVPQEDRNRQVAFDPGEARMSVRAILYERKRRNAPGRRTNEMSGRAITSTPHGGGRWEEEDSNLRRLRRRFYRPLPLATRASSREPTEDSNRSPLAQEIRLHGANVRMSRFRSRQWPMGCPKVTDPARSRHVTDW